MSKLTKEELAEAYASIWKSLTEGEGDHEIADALGLDAEEFEKFKRRVLDKRAQTESGKPVERVFVEYMVSQLGNVHELTILIDELKGYSDVSKTASARVAAIKTRAAIYDSILEKGQDTGVFRREPTKVVGGFVVADLATAELRALVAEQIRGLSEMTRKFSGPKLTEIAMERDALHYGKALPSSPSVIDVTPERTKEPSPKPKRSKRTAGKKSRTSAKARGRRIRDKE